MEGPVIEQLSAVLAGARRGFAFTGAGISTESGIPDFRGPQGIWTKLDPSDFTIDNYLSNPGHRRRVWRMRLEGADRRFEPNDGHRALAELERLGVLHAVVTQNIDGLHQDAGSSVVLEVHGNTREIRCLGCEAHQEMSAVLERVRAGEHDPHCLACGGLLKSATISFGEALPPAVIDESFRIAEASDLCLVVGSSLVVYPAAGVPIAAVRTGARLVILNEEPTPLDNQAAFVVRSKAGPTLRAAVERLRELRAATEGR